LNCKNVWFERDCNCWDHRLKQLSEFQLVCSSFVCEWLSVCWLSVCVNKTDRELQKKLWPMLSQVVWGLRQSCVPLYHQRVDRMNALYCNSERRACCRIDCIYLLLVFIAWRRSLVIWVDDHWKISDDHLLPLDYSVVVECWSQVTRLICCTGQRWTCLLLKGQSVVAGRDAVILNSISFTLLNFFNFCDIIAFLVDFCLFDFGSSGSWAVNKVFRGCKRGKFNIVFLCGVSAVDYQTQAVIKTNSLLVVSADVEAEVRWVVYQEVFHQLAPNSLPLTTRSYANTHQVRTLRHLDVVLLLNLTLLLDVFFGRLLSQERCVSYNCLCVGFLCHDNLVDLWFPKGLDNHSRVPVFVEGISVDLAERFEVFGLVLFSLFNYFDHDFALLSLRRRLILCLGSLSLNSLLTFHSFLVECFCHV